MQFCTLVALTLLTVGEAPDISSVAPDLKIPALKDGPPEAGKRCKQTTAGWEKTDVYHVLYLPANWQPGKKYPVFVEWAGNGNYLNKFGDVSTGRAEDSKMGFGISGGVDYLWVCMPYLDDAGTKNVTMWWGDAKSHKPQATLDYCVKTVKSVCEEWGGDPDRVALMGFSRGAIACNALGLANDDIAKLWRGMIPFSHYHGLNERWPFPGSDRMTALKHLARLGKTPQFICSEMEESLERTKELLAKSSGDFTFRHTGFRNHNDAWLLRPSPVRAEIRAWLKKITAD